MIMPARVWRKFASLVANTSDPKKVGSTRWNEDLGVFLGTVCEALAKLQITSNKMPFFISSDEAALADLTVLARSLLSAETLTDLAARGLATLDENGKLLIGQLPAIAITDTHTVASQAAMLALDAEPGDVAVRSDENKSYILQGDDPTDLADWVWLKTPTDAVLSVAGLTGVISAAGLKAALAIAVADITDASANGRSLISAANYAAMKTLLGLAAVASSGAYGDLSGLPSLGTAAAKNFGTSAGQLVEVQTGGKLPALDASNLLNLPSIPTLGSSSSKDIADAAAVRAMTSDKVLETAGVKSAMAYVDLGNVSGNITPDFTTFINLKLTLTGSGTLKFPSVDLTPVIGRSGMIEVNEDGTGGRTLGYDVPGTSGYIFDGGTAVSIDTTASRKTKIGYHIASASRIELYQTGKGVR